jgi:heme-degrading monooxygenase HmoA
MHAILWEFRVRPGREQEFERGYCPDGDWAQLFRRAEGYLGTELTRSTTDAQHYYTLDRWSSKAAFENFRQGFDAEYRALDAKFVGLTEREGRIGVLASDAI